MRAIEALVRKAAKICHVDFQELQDTTIYDPVDVGGYMYVLNAAQVIEAFAVWDESRKRTDQRTLKLAKKAFMKEWKNIRAKSRWDA